MGVRKCHEGEITNIIMVANKCFATDREEGFTFVKSVPHIYNNDLYDYSNIHFVEEVDGNMVAIGGNLINEFCIDSKLYKFSRVGTIGTLPEYRNKGYMKNIMDAIHQENIEKNLVFSVLTGDRDNYKRHGYEKACLSSNYVFKKKQLKYLNKKYSVSIRKYNDKDLNKLYAIYLNNQKIILRNKENFVFHVNCGNCELYVIDFNDEIVGYYSIKGNMINEIYFKDIKYLESSMFEILKCVNYDEIVVYVNMLDRELFEKFSKVADCKNVYEKLCIKVYDFKRFLNLLYSLNKEKFSSSHSEVYKINDSTYEFAVSKNSFNVTKTNKDPIKTFSNEFDFLRFVLGADSIYGKSDIFPLFFDLNAADKF